VSASPLLLKNEVEEGEEEGGGGCSGLSSSVKAG
jgi:hypothetical protein